jgi:thioredoxin-related protein
VKILCSTLLFLALLLLDLVSAQAEADWSTNFAKAQADAKSAHKLLLINFSGSDWCGWCKRLESEVFSKPEFEQYAKDNLVLVMADFPRRKTLSNEVRKQNYELAERFQVGGFPTIVVLNGEGKQIGQLGYMPGGPGAFIGELKKLPKS